MAGSVLAETSITAVAWAGLDRAIRATEVAVAIACSIEASAVGRAVVGAQQVAAIITTKTRVAIAGEVLAHTMASAIIGAGSHRAVK